MADEEANPSVPAEEKSEDAPTTEQTPQDGTDAEPQSSEVAPPLGEAPAVEDEKPAETDKPSSPTDEQGESAESVEVVDQSDKAGVNQTTNEEQDNGNENASEIQGDDEKEEVDAPENVDEEVPLNNDVDEVEEVDQGAQEHQESEKQTDEENEAVDDKVTKEAPGQEPETSDLSEGNQTLQDDTEKTDDGETDEKVELEQQQEEQQQQMNSIEEEDEEKIEEAANDNDDDNLVAPPMIDGQEQETAEGEGQQADAQPQQEETTPEEQPAAAEAAGEGEATAAAEKSQEKTAAEEETAPQAADGQEQAQADVKPEQGEGQVEEQKAAEDDKAPDAAVGETDLGDTAGQAAESEETPKQSEEGEATEQEKEGGGQEEEKKSEEEGGEKEQEKKDDDVDGEKKETTEEQKETEAAGEEGDKEDEEEKKKKKEEEEDTIPEDFYYNFEDHASKAVVAQDSGLPLDMLSMQHSYGYDCKKRNNLHLLDETTVVFAAGNMLQILNLKTRSQTYLRSTSGWGIGAICVHPSRKYFAVGEKGEAPNINIFEFPSLKLYRIMRGGTEQSYTSLTFSPDGELLASQGGEPDFMLTVWNWRQEKTTLRTKSFSQDVFRVSFAPELEGQLTTAGSGHIRFWKMADTFTGLKLQGELGRFGRTEISDIEGYVELPDGKVLSGSEWGNLLLWDGGLIKVEITTKSKKNCHSGPIMQILLDEGELMTVGSDGFIRVWDFEAIDTADSTDDSGMFHMDPMNELQVGAETGDEVHLYTIVKSVDDENEPTIWYAQDANGGIWKLDLSFSHTSQAPEKLFTFHAGSISGCVSSPLTHLAVSAGLDKTVRAFDYIQMKQLAEVKFSAGGTCIEWVPLTVDTKGSSVVVGFHDGVVRSLTVTKLEGDHSRRHEKQEAEIVLKQAFKPHNGPVTAMAFDGKGEVLATGSSDGTVFFLYVSEVYDPIGFIKVPGAVRQLVWTPEKFKRTALMVVCEDGVVLEVDAPEPGNFDTSHTFEISGLPIKSFKFKSIKSHLRHEEELEREKIEEEERKKKEEEERRKRIERGLETESEAGDEEVDQKPKTPKPEWHPYIPEEPSPILNASYAEQEGQFWLSMGEFDAGYLYKCKFTTPEEQAVMMPDNIDKPLMSIPVQESNDVPIHVIKYSQSGQRVMFGMANGQIRIQQLEEPHDLAQLGPQWTLSVHDNNYGHITALASSFDGSMMLTTGADGNFFQFSFMSQEAMEEKIKENKARLPSAKDLAGKVVDDIDDPNAYSIEDAKQKTEHDKRMKEAEQKKRDVRKKINQMRRQFKTILEQNDNMPKHLQLSRQEFEMDREIKQELHQQTVEKIDLVRRELAWDSERLQISLEKLRKRFKDVVECERIVVRAFTTSHEVSSFRASKLSDDFYQLKADFERRKTKLPTKDDFSRDPTKDLGAAQRKLLEGGGLADDGLEGGPGSKVTTTLKGSMGERVNNALQKVEEKKKKRAARRALWEELYSRKPDDDYEDPQDVAAIKEAQENMGDYKLKTAADYVVPDHLRMNVDKARGRLLSIKDMIHEYKYKFNVRLLALRDKKIQVIDQIRDIVKKLHEIQTRLQDEKHLPIPPVPELHADEMPERILEYTRETLKQFKIQYDIKQKQAKSGGGGSAGGDGGGFGFGFGGGDSGGAPPPAEKQNDCLFSF
ncbi:cilia- and flagella-associated protein 44-like [Elysia marginata]|uniref:Cilia- and flagella-associated protein 44 n=1 Tax=Elysia marginata TaxID=1093978 RepID=A0AAV4GAL7_9GAST|nr:cilia- and flagella-associated protein 44-like [Elysia marginata]